MSTATPHFLLFSESRRGAEQGRWRFMLESLDGTDTLEASDVESGVHGERLELLAVVRGLEALPQPSRVTLVTPSRYVDRGLTDGLPEWRTNNWQWEHFGEMAPVKNRDLWQRIDRALEYHQVECRLRRIDEPAQPSSKASPLLSGPNYLRHKHPARRQNATRRHDEPEVVAISEVTAHGPPVTCNRRWHVLRRRGLVRRLGGLLALVKIRLAQLGTGLLPPPWFD